MQRNMDSVVESTRSQSARFLTAWPRFLSRFPIGPRLTSCFLALILLMLAGDALLLWQFHAVRLQADALASLDQQSIAVLRFHDNLRSAYDELNELAQSRDAQRLPSESEKLRTTFMQEAGQAERVLRNLPPGAAADPSLLISLETVSSALPSHLNAVEALAASGDWTAILLRLEQDVRPMESSSSDLVKKVDHEVAVARAQAASNIALVERRMILISVGTGFLTLLLGSLLGVAITHSITAPLDQLMEASQAMAGGEFCREIEIAGNDELAHLGSVFNDTSQQLCNLYDDLRAREEKLFESEKELRQLIELVPTHVFVLKPDGSGLYANQRVLDYHGLTLSEWMAGAFQAGIVHQHDAQKYVADLQGGFSKGQAFETEARLRGKDGTYRWFLSRFNPMQDESGTILRWYAARTDIEESKQQSERERKEYLALREEVSRSGALEEILGSSDKLVRVLSEVSRVAPTDSTVLILGETGTGKELVARSLHRQSSRSTRPFIAVNCAAIPASLLSSELFGHEKGAFTGAVQRRLGRFEAANGGTIFLDEIGELPSETQLTLLRVIQERVFERVGGNQPISADVRILAATNRDLRSAVSTGTFRQDLFYRLNVFPIQLPPLRERKGDIPLLIEYFIERHAKKTGKTIRSIKSSTLELLESYPWPGNVRELQNVVERAVLLCDGDTLSVDEAWLKSEVRLGSQPIVELHSLGKLDTSREREIIESALAASGGRISGPSGAAVKLGIPRQTLESKMARLGISKSRYQDN